MDSLPPPPDDLNASRGAKNVITSCLCVARNERVHVLTYHADALYTLMARTIEDAGAVPVRVELDTIDNATSTVAEYTARLSPQLAGATATILLAPVRPSAALSLAVAKVAESMGARHLHLLQVDDRLLGQGVRADPELLAIVNTRLVAALQPPCQIKITSDAGTDLEARLALTHPLMSSSGRPAPRASENLPAGHVFTHPARVSGTLIVDRAIFGPGLSIERAAVRRNPVRVTFVAGRVRDFEARDPAIKRAIEAYLASHTNAGRVGLLVLPTNYLVRSEIGIDRQDMLLPGVTVSLGYASPDTGATYEAPVQMVFLGRRQTVEVAGRKLVDAGRFDQTLVLGIDPFR
jgi:leucyl aminopeptidase (aminopeptidase T)